MSEDSDSADGDPGELRTETEPTLEGLEVYQIDGESFEDEGTGDET